jgi:integrase
MAEENNTADARIEKLRAEQIRLSSVLLAPNTSKGYRHDWRNFLAWCKEFNLPPLPAAADTVSLFTTHELSRGQKVSSVKRKLAAIVHVHRAHGHQAPDASEARMLLKAARRDRDREEQVRRVNPLAILELREICLALAKQDTPIAMRDRAILVVGFASGLRSANLVALKLSDVTFGDQGATLHVRREKQDQEGRDGVGRSIGLPHGKHPETCPVTALRDWIGRRGSYAGPLFTRFDRPNAVGVPIQPERVCQLVQEAVRRVGRDPSLFGGHSLRASFVTAAVEANVDELLIMAQTGHHDRRSLAAYFRRRDLFRSNPVTFLDL